MTATANSSETISLMLESTLAVDAIFFALFTLLGAWLNETVANLAAGREREAVLRAEYEEHFQSRDLLDPQRQRAAEALREIQRGITIARGRGSLLSGALIAVTAVIVAATFVLVYSYSLLDHEHVDEVLHVAFYVLMVAPLVSAIVMVAIIRRLHTGL